MSCSSSGGTDNHDYSHRYDGQTNNVLCSIQIPQKLRKSHNPTTWTRFEQTDMMNPNQPHQEQQPDEDDDIVDEAEFLDSNDVIEVATLDDTMDHVQPMDDDDDDDDANDDSTGEDDDDDED